MSSSLAGTSELPPNVGVANTDVDRNALFADVKVVQNAIKSHTILHKVRGIFDQVSHDNFQSVRDQLCALPIRQSDDKEVTEIIHWIYDKAVQPEDENYVELYADLIKELINEIHSKNAAKASVLRSALVNKCQQSFDKRSDVGNASADEIVKAEATAGSQDSAAEAALKHAVVDVEDPDYIKIHARAGLRASMKFLAQLLRVQMITSKVVNFLLYSLLYGTGTANGDQRHRPEDYEVEMFVELLKDTRQFLPSDIRENYLPKYLETVKGYSKGQRLSKRVAFLVDDLLDLAENGWLTRDQRRSMGLLGASTNSNVDPNPGQTDAVPK